MKYLKKKNKTTYEEGWDYYSKIWDNSVKKSNMRFLGDEWGSENLARDIVDSLVKPYLEPNPIILEIGCGGGKYSVLLAPLAMTLICSDVSSKMLERTQKRLGHLNNVNFQKLNGLDFSQFRENSIDFIFSFDVFVHIDMEDVYFYLQEIRRILKPGGGRIASFCKY